MTVLEEAKLAVEGPRQENYGSPRTNLERIAKIWSVTLGMEVTWQQVAQCMIGLKLARLANTPDHRDSWVDIAGYAACWDKGNDS